MKILLTGAGGFIGSVFTRAAVAKGHQVAGLLVPQEPVPSGLVENRNTRWLRGTMDEAPWNEIAEFAPEVCVHTAWVTAPGVYLESPDNYKFLESSIKFLRKVNENGTNHLVGLGTCIEYQIGNQKLSEDTTPIAPTTTYSRCKNELRLVMQADAKRHGFKCCWARVFYPYGPGEHPSRLCSSIIQKLSRGEQIVLKTPNSTKDYIFIEDLAEALLTVVEKQFEGEINLGTGIGISVREIGDTLAGMMGKPEAIQEANPPEVDPLGYVVADPSRLLRLGWRPTHDIAVGLQSLLNRWQERLAPRTND